MLLQIAIQNFKVQETTITEYKRKIAWEEKNFTSLGHKIDEILYFCQSLYRLQFGHSTLIQQGINTGVALKRKGENQRQNLKHGSVQCSINYWSDTFVCYALEPNLLQVI